MGILNIDATIKCTIYIYIKYQNFNKHIRYTIYETFDHIGEFNHDLNMIYPVNNFCRSSWINRTTQTSRIFLDTVNITINYHFIHRTVLTKGRRKKRRRFHRDKFNSYLRVSTNINFTDAYKRKFQWNFHANIPAVCNAVHNRGTENRNIGGLHWYIYDSQCKRRFTIHSVGR